MASLSQKEKNETREVKSKTTNETGIDTTKTQFEPQQKYYLPFNYPPYYITLDTVHALIGICEKHNDCIVVYFPDGDCEFHTGTKADRRYLIDEIESML